MHLNVDQFEIWKNKRKYTAAVFVLQIFLLGLEYSVTFLILWPYLKDLVQPSQPKVYFSVISAAYIVGALSIQLIIARISDKEKCVRKLMTVCNCMLIIGNLLYSLPFSPWLLLFGRFIAGGGASMRAIMTGELARVYDDDALFKKLSMMGMAYTCGVIVGPAVNIMFASVDFFIGNWHLNFENLPGLYLTSCFIFAQTLVILLVHDLSKEYDLKTDIKLNEEDQVNQTTKVSIQNTQLNSGSYDNRMKGDCPQYDTTDSIFGYTLYESAINKPQSNDQYLNNSLAANRDEEALLLSENHESSLIIFIKLLRNVDCLLIFVVTFLGMYILVTVDMWLPLLVLDTIPYGNVLMMNLLVLGSAVTCIIGMIIIMFKTVSAKQSYVLAILSLIMLACIISVFLVLSQYNNNLILSAIMWIVYCVSFGFAITNVEIFCPGCLSKLVDSRIQTVAEGFRLSFERTGSLLALLTSALIFDYVELVGLVYIVIIALSVFCMLLRRKILSQPRVMIH